MTRCQDCGGDHAPSETAQACACCSDAPATCAEPCPGCDRVPADDAGYAVTVWVEGVASQEDADQMVERLVGGLPAGVLASVVRG